MEGVFGEQDPADAWHGPAYEYRKAMSQDDAQIPDALQCDGWKYLALEFIPEYRSCHHRCNGSPVGRPEWFGAGRKERQAGKNQDNGFDVVDSGLLARFIGGNQEE
ncbi:hypothetical protein BLA6992_00297 [Burkholderia lata]|nr:hypothetical protein [Burkholderia lata]VWL87875.1 hypothetical protein BLA6992_00297 [Burkholderia lata]